MSLRVGFHITSATELTGSKSGTLQLHGRVNLGDLQESAGYSVDGEWSL